MINILRVIILTWHTKVFAKEFNRDWKFLKKCREWFSTINSLGNWECPILCPGEILLPSRQIAIDNLQNNIRTTSYSNVIFLIFKFMLLAGYMSLSQRWHAGIMFYFIMFYAHFVDQNFYSNHAHTNLILLKVDFDFDGWRSPENFKSVQVVVHTKLN